MTKLVIRDTETGDKLATIKGDNIEYAVGSEDRSPANVDYKGYGLSFGIGDIKIEVYDDKEK